MTFVERIIGSTVLDVPTFEDVEADRSSTGQAMGVVLMSAVAAGIGARGFGGPISLLPLAAVVALLSWAAWALLTYEIGARLLPGPNTKADVTELMRTIGFAAAPGMLRVVGVVPAFAIPIFVLTEVWMLLAMVIAVRQALDYQSTARALAVCGLALVLTLVFVVAIGLLASPVLS